MIDLGDELDGFTDDEPSQPRRAQQPTPQPHPDGGSTMPLADLQAAGFATQTWQDTVRQGIVHSSDWKIRWSGQDDDPPSFYARTWLPGDDDKASPPWTIVTGDARPTLHYMTIDENDGFELKGRIDE